MPRTAETRHEVVEAILADPRPTFASILEHLARRLDPEAVLADSPATTPVKRSAKTDEPENENSMRKKYYPAGDLR